jgi:hypothetical protein
MSKPTSHRAATAAEVEALARELAADYGLTMDVARAAARRAVRGLLAYAEQWEQWAAERRPAQPPTA